MKKTLIILLLLPIVSFAGGPWTQKKGKGYFQLGATTKKYSGRYVGNYAQTTHYLLNRNVVESSAWLYGEYGLSDKLELDINIPYVSLHTGKVNILDTLDYPYLLPKGNVSGLGNSTIAFKYKLKESNYVLSTKLNLGLNTSVRDAKNGLQTGYDAIMINPSMLIGKGYDKSYFSAELGYRYLTNKYAQSATATIQYGYKIFPKTWLMAEVNGLFSLENGTHNDANYTQTAAYVDNQGYIAMGGKIVQYLTENISLNLAGYTGFIGTVNQGDNQGQLFFGIAYEIK